MSIPLFKQPVGWRTGWLLLLSFVACDSPAIQLVNTTLIANVATAQIPASWHPIALPSYPDPDTTVLAEAFWGEAKDRGCHIELLKGSNTTPLPTLLQEQILEITRRGLSVTILSTAITGNRMRVECASSFNGQPDFIFHHVAYIYAHHTLYFHFRCPNTRANRHLMEAILSSLRVESPEGRTIRQEQEGIPGDRGLLPGPKRGIRSLQRERQ